MFFYIQKTKKQTTAFLLLPSLDFGQNDQIQCCFGPRIVLNLYRGNLIDKKNNVRQTGLDKKQ